MTGLSKDSTLRAAKEARSKKPVDIVFGARPQDKSAPTTSVPAIPIPRREDLIELKWCPGTHGLF